MNKKIVDGSGLIRLDFERRGLDAIGKVELLIRSAITSRVTDIHIDPLEGVGHRLVRVRIDGIISLFATLSQISYQEIIARIKVLSRLRIDIQHLPQDGRFELSGSSIRVSTVPTLFGESLVMRILNLNNNVPTFLELGFDLNTCTVLNGAASSPSGLIVVSGPTGSGKTTVLYSLMNYIGQLHNHAARSIVTIEDPVERVLPFARQIPVRDSLGLSFVTLLRTVLRQDPDVIVVGEIRDRETATIAVGAAMTGHLVITTLHASYANEVRARLLSMGIAKEDYDAVHVLSMSVRLVRVKCFICSQNAGAISSAECEQCGGTGWHGRTSISEYIHYEQQSPTIYSNGLSKVEAGITTQSEVERVVARD